MSLCLEKPELSLFSWVTVHSSSGPALAIVLLFCAPADAPSTARVWLCPWRC